MAKAKAVPVKLALRLYIAGLAPNSMRAIANAKAICSEHFALSSVLEIVDVEWHARQALADGIIITPTLLKLRPSPAQRLIGDLSDTDQVLRTLSAK
jgi:circadian clock protein KaiB